MNYLIGTFPVPPFLLPVYEAAGIDYRVPWQVLAAINEIESDYGRNLSTSSAGAVGWMQFLPSTWAKYGIDADGAGAANPYDPMDAIFAAARYLNAAGAGSNLSDAIFAYNHANWYVNSVELRAKLLQALPSSLIDGLTELMQARYPVAGPLGRSARRAPTPVELDGQPAVELKAPAGARVIAGADGRVVGIGHNARSGEYITIEDSYGDRFTYSQLSSLELVYPVIRPHVESAARFARELRLRAGSARKRVLPAATSATPLATPATPSSSAAGPGRAGHSSTTSTAVVAAPASPSSTGTTGTSAPLPKERLFAHPLRSASYAAGGELQLQLSLSAYANSSGVELARRGASDYFAQSLRLRPGRFTLAPLHPGVTVLAGTVLGRVASGPKGTTGIVLQIRPSGAKTPVDPRPIVAGWEVLGTLTAGRSALAGAGQTGAYGMHNTALGQLLLSGKSALERAVLADPRIKLDACDRRGIAAGHADGRALAAIEYLSYSGLAPTVSRLVCGEATGFEVARGTQLEISALGGVRVAGHQGDGGPVDLAIRTLLGLEGALRPSKIISLRSYPWEPTAIALPDHAARLEVDFSAPRTGGSALQAGRMDTAEWQRLIERLTRLGAQPGEPGAVAPTTATATTATPTTATSTVTTPMASTPAITTPVPAAPTMTAPRATPPATTQRPR